MDNKSQQAKTESDLYVETFDKWQQKAYEIAKEHLGSSFHLERSNGFNEWKKTRQQQSISILLHPK